MTPRERVEKRLEEALALAESKEPGAIPSPEGEVVADAYVEGKLDSLSDLSTCLHVIACLLRQTGEK